MIINHEGCQAVIARPCTYCEATGRTRRYRCPVCNPDGYLSDILQEDREAQDRRPPVVLVADMEKRLGRYEM